MEEAILQYQTLNPEPYLEGHGESVSRLVTLILGGSWGLSN